MNNENFQYLTDNIKYMGFGENLKPELERNLKEGKSDFQLIYSNFFNKKPFEATLNFRKSDSSDMYFFNNYHASLEKNNGSKVEQTFYLNKGKGVTTKEAYNLLQGRSVHKDLVTKEGAPYKAWLQLDLEKKDGRKNHEIKQFHENYGFDLKEELKKFPIVELKDPEKEKSLMQSLQKGNLQFVELEKEGKNHSMLIEANPQFKKINLYDSDIKLIPKESLDQYKSVNLSPAPKLEEKSVPDKKKEIKQEVKPEQSKSIDKKVTKSLLPKKKVSHKKGLSIG